MYIDEIIVDFEVGYKIIVVMSGDFNVFIFNVYLYECEIMEDYFWLFVFLVVVDDLFYDFYMSELGDLFEVVNFLGIVIIGDMIELNYWDVDDDSDYFDEGEYIIYFIELGSDEVVFEL